MANFFTRLAERSLGLSSVVQPAIASRFSSTSALPDGDFQWDGKTERSPTPVHPEPSLNVSFPQPIFLVQEQLSTPEPYPIQEQAQSDASIAASLPNQLLQSASTLPEPNSKQSILPVANPIAPIQSIGEESSQVASLEPFRVLHPREHIPSQQNSLVPVPVIVARHPDESDRNTENRLAPSAQAVIQPDLRSIVSSSEFPQAPAERESLPPTIRVSIGRVEVRAIMPTAPTPKAAPVRPRPAVSLNDYLKQRGSKT